MFGVFCGVIDAGRVGVVPWRCLMVLSYSVVPWRCPVLFYGVAPWCCPMVLVLRRPYALSLGRLRKELRSTRRWRRTAARAHFIGLKVVGCLVFGDLGFGSWTLI